MNPPAPPNKELKCAAFLFVLLDLLLPVNRHICLMLPIHELNSWMWLSPSTLETKTHAQHSLVVLSFFPTFPPTSCLKSYWQTSGLNTTGSSNKFFLKYLPTLVIIRHLHCIVELFFEALHIFWGGVLFRFRFFNLSRTYYSCFILVFLFFYGANK